MKTRGNALALAGFLLGIALLAVTLLWPGVQGFVGVLDAPDPGADRLQFDVLVRTLAWSLIVALGSAVIGVVAGNALARLLSSRAGRLAAAASVVPICLPGYAVFWCWWQAFGPGSVLGAWAIQNDLVVNLRESVLFLALVCWSWPLVAWPVALSIILEPNPAAVLARLDGAPCRVRLGILVRRQWMAVVLGMLLVAFFTAGATTSFDLAQVTSIGFELRALDALGVEPGTLLRVAWPSIAIAFVGGACFLLLIRGTGGRFNTALSARASRGGRAAGPWVLFASLLVVTVIVPLLLAGFGERSLDLGMYWALHAGGTMRTLLGAVFDGFMAAVLAGTLFTQHALGGRFLRVMAILIAAFWVAAALLPAMVISAAMTRGYNTPMLGPIVYDSGVALALGHLAMCGGVVAAIALFFARTEPRSLGAIRSLDPPRLAAIAPRLRSVLIMSFAVGTVLSMGELVVSSRLGVPGQDRIASSLLNAMHYQRPDTVMIALGGLVLVGWLLAFLVAFGVPRRVRIGPGAMVLLLALLPIMPGCTDAPLEDEGPTRVPSELLVGAPGQAPGLFSTPRGIAVDPERGRFYVVDKSARVQRFSLDGTFEHEWSMPESVLGKPVGISVAPDGRVYVPDTHYNRVIVYEPDGTEVRRFGSFGVDLGEFVYPTDIAFGSDGRVYVAEYGTNDRIQVFDADGMPLFTFGSLGSGDGQFTRPQSIAFSNDGEELYVADACNHRIVVFSPEGDWLRSFGAAGSAPGELSYPYGLAVLPDGTLLVSEYGSNRIQRFNPTSGSSLGTWGAAGFQKGLLRTPWGVAHDGRRVYVLDSGNARVQAGSFQPLAP